MSGERRWTLICTLGYGWKVKGPLLDSRQPVEVMPVEEHEAELQSEREKREAAEHEKHKAIEAAGDIWVEKRRVEARLKEVEGERDQWERDHAEEERRVCDAERDAVKAERQRDSIEESYTRMKRDPREDGVLKQGEDGNWYRVIVTNAEPDCQPTDTPSQDDAPSVPDQSRQPEQGGDAGGWPAPASPPVPMSGERGSGPPSPQLGRGRGMAEESAGEYRTIVADPPWEISRKIRPGGRRARRTEVPYAFMPLERIEALPVAEWAAEDCALFLWSTRRNFREGTAAQVARAWGFEPCGEVIWGLRNPGLGTPRALAAGHEPILVARRGSPEWSAEAPMGVHFWRQPYYPNGGGKIHSAKPDAFLDHVEQWSPGPYLELFARRDRLGWDTFGDESLNTAEIPEMVGGASQMTVDDVLEEMRSG